MLIFVEIASGWGKLGSNPLEISRYLDRKKVTIYLRVITGIIIGAIKVIVH